MAAPTPTAEPSRLPLLLAILAVLTLYRALVLYWSGLDLYLDEAQYWTWAQHLQWGYYSKPPVIAGLIALTTSACGDGTFCVKGGALLLYPIVGLLMWALARRLYGERVAFWSALVFILAPGVSLSSMIISTDVPFFLFWTAALYCYVRALEDDRLAWWLLTGLAGGLGLLTKYTMGIFAVSVLLHLALTPSLRHHLRNPKLYAAALVALLVFAPNLWWNSHNGWPTLRHTGDISELGNHAGLHWNHLSDFLGSQFAVLGPILFGAWLGLTLWRPRGWWINEKHRLLACFAIPFLGIIGLQALFGRANANWGAMAYVTASIFVAALLIERRAFRWLVAGIAVNAGLMLIGYHFDVLTRTLGIPVTARIDPYKRVRGWAELGRQATLLQAQYPRALFLADSRDLMAELEYYVRPHPLDAVLWNPHHIMDNHYALTTTMDGKRDREFIYVTAPGPLPDELRDSFEYVEALPPLHVSVHPDFALDYAVWHLDRFRGYNSLSPVP